ncbi:LRRN4 protein, partial [Crocuta crocuta]
VQSGWIRDLRKLKILYLRKMPRLRTLEGDIFKMTPDLQQLDCQDSSALTSRHTGMHQDVSQALPFLSTCNLSSFPPWSLHSSQVLTINLFGNPLICSCELAWLLKDAQRIVLSRAADTVCTTAVGSQDTFSAPLLLSYLPSTCHLDQSTTLPDSNSPYSVAIAHAPSTQSPATPQSTAPSAAPVEVRQSVTETPSLPASSPTRTAWLHSGIGTGTPPSAATSTAESSKSSALRRAASTAGTEHQEERATRLVHGPDSAAASPPQASKHLGLLSTAWNPVRTPQPSHRPQATRQVPHPSPSEDTIPILLLDDSSEEEEEEGAGEKEEVGAPPQDVPCDYQPCKHLQTPCAELQRLSRCRCPGLSGEDTVPDPPRLQAVTETTDTSALVRWCAPNSVVRGYQLRYSAEGGRGNQSASVVAGIYATARQHPLYGLSPGTTYRVCVLAANRAGLSRARASGWARPCAAFTTKPSFVLIFAGLCAACALLLVTTLLLSACLCRQARTPHPRRYDTHLVAYKNPAFDYRLKLQTVS